MVRNITVSGLPDIALFMRKSANAGLRGAAK